jgi:amidase
MRAIFLVSILQCLVIFSRVVSAQSSFEVMEVNISELQNALSEGRVSSVELVDSYLERISAYDKQGPALNSIIRINPEARSIAAQLDAERETSAIRSPLHGIPILVKDNYNTTTMPTTGGSVALADFIPSENSTQINRLIEAGAIILAKTNLHEYAYGITSVGSLVGQTRNPYDIRRVPGGSSGGTGAAVAASFGAIGLGSDTCGSIRIPSAFNNLVGLRPTKGLSSIYGVMPLSHTQDVAGPLARNSTDLAILLDVVVGYDEKDEATSIMLFQESPEFVRNLNSVNLEGLRIGKLQSYFDRADTVTRRTIESTLEHLEQQGAEVVEIEISEAESLIGQSALIGHEFKNDLNQYLALFISDEIMSLDDIVDLGLFHEAVEGALSRSHASVFNETEYNQAVAVRIELRELVESVLIENQLDALVYPTIAELPVIIGESQPGNNCSLSANSGLPAISLPAGFSDSGLPVGMELLGAYLSDVRLVSIAHALEQSKQSRQPPSVTPPLENGEAPSARKIEIAFNDAGAQFSASFEINMLFNTLAYQIQIDPAGSAEIYAITLIIDDPDALGLTAPIIANFLGPNMDLAAGEVFMSPQLRMAIHENRAYLKIFADSLPPVGAIRRLD